MSTLLIVLGFIAMVGVGSAEKSATKKYCTIIFVTCVTAACAMKVAGF